MWVLEQVNENQPSFDVRIDRCIEAWQGSGAERTAGINYMAEAFFLIEPEDFNYIFKRNYHFLL